MAQIKITLTIDTNLWRDAHAAIDAMDAKLRERGGRVVTGKLKPGAASVDADGNKHFSLAKLGAPQPEWTTTEPAPLTRWCVLFTRIPTNYNNQQRLIVEAATEADAYKLAKRHIGDEGKTFDTYHIESVKPHNPEPIAGRVIGGAS